MIHSGEGHDGSVAVGPRAPCNQMSVTIGIAWVRGNFRIVVSSQIVRQLMSKTIISQGAGLGDDGEGFSTTVGCKITNSATIETSSKESGGISSVPQGLG